MHGTEHGPLRCFGPALRLAGALLGLGDAFLDLAQALPALLLLRFQLCKALGLRCTPFRRFGALLDLAQALLRFGERALLRFASLLQALFGGLKVGRRRRRGRWRNRSHALRRLPGLGLRSPCLGLALKSLRLLDAPIRLGADPLLLALDFGDLVVNALFGHGRVVFPWRGRRCARWWRLWRHGGRHRSSLHWRHGRRNSLYGGGWNDPRLGLGELRRWSRRLLSGRCALLLVQRPLLCGSGRGELALGLGRLLTTATPGAIASTRLAATLGSFPRPLFAAPLRFFLAALAMLGTGGALLQAGLLALLPGAQRLARGWRHRGRGSARRLRCLWLGRL